MSISGKRHGPFAKSPRRFAAALEELKLVMSFIPFEAFPQGIDRLRWPLNLLNKKLFGVEQMPRDAQVAVALAALHQQIEKCKLPSLWVTFER